MTTQNSGRAAPNDASPISGSSENMKHSDTGSADKEFHKNDASLISGSPENMKHSDTRSADKEFQKNDASPISGQSGNMKAGDTRAAGKKSPTKSPRRRAREFAIQGLYQHLIGGQDEAAIRAQSETVAGYDKADEKLFVALVSTAIDEFAALRQALTPHLDRDWESVSPIERSVLLLGACELMYFPETPYRVIINEAIELAKTFGGTDGHKFVNGILDKLAPQVRPLEAKGRG